MLFHLFRTHETRIAADAEFTFDRSATFWQDELARRGWSSHAIDLRGHGHSEPIDLGTTKMEDYADDVVTIARTVVLGWEAWADWNHRPRSGPSARDA
jgi:pimeloyl-ACP methyl ester carboxylesterase